MIIKLDATKEEVARNILSIQIPAYKVEAEIIGFHEIPQLLDTVETIMNCGETFIGYILEGELAGVVSYIDNENDVDICRLVVDPKHFRKGIAKKLVGHVTRNIAENHAKIIVSTGAMNLPAKSLYRSFGFREINKIEVSPGIFLSLMERKQLPKNGADKLSAPTALRTNVFVT